jgi:hypothetical protein
MKQVEPQTIKGGTVSVKDEYKMRRYVNFLNNMTPVQQGALVPYIRLFVKQFKNEKFISTKEIVFNREYKIPNGPQGAFAGGGRGNAGIERLQVDRDFQYFDVVNRFTVQLNYLFDSFDTFANGMQYSNVLGAAISANQIDDTDSILGTQQGSGYISLIKKGSENIDGGVLREYLFLHYGYKFPDSLSEEIVSLEDRLIFEEQEKKELRIDCYKHDFTFSETGEVRLSVTYNAVPDVALASRNEEKTNDVFLISNKGLISEMMDEPSDALSKNEKTRTALFATIEEKLNELKKLNDERKRKAFTYCGDENVNDISKIDEEIKDINKRIYSIKKEFLDYMYLFFLRYFMTHDSLFNVRFTPVPLELERGVLNPCDVVIRADNQITKLYIDKISKKVGAEQDILLSFDIKTNYKNKIKSILEREDKDNKGIIYKKSFDSQEVALQNLKRRFEGLTAKDGKRVNDATSILISDLEYESYACYQALQTFTLSRMSAQAAIIRTGIKGKKCEETNETGLNPLGDAANYAETYGNISFFPLKALLAAAINFTLDTKEDQNNFPIICLGSVMTESMDKKYFTSIGDLLVDVNFFKEWLYKSFINREKIDPTLDDFFNAIFQSLVPNILTAGVGHYTKGRHGYISRKVYEVSENVYRNEQLLKDLVSTDPTVRDNASKMLMKDAITPSKKEQVKRPLIIYYQETLGRPEDVKQSKSLFLKDYGKRNFDKKRDYTDGIYHVLMGQNSGIVKQINFSYLADPNLNTLFAMKNPNHLASYMKYSYEANIDFVGNDLFFNKVNYFAIPNNQFNVSNTGLSYSAEKDIFGLTGYYQVSKTTDKISAGEYTTTVTARNMYSPSLEEIKSKKCKNRKEITDDKKQTKNPNATEPPINDYVDLDIGEYIFEAFRDAPTIASIFDVKYTKELKEDIKRKSQETEEKLKE